MVYGDLDLATEERRAWQSGDYSRAEALALAIDGQEAAEEAESARQETEEQRDDKYDKAQEAWAKHNEAMRQRLDNLRQLVEQAARVSGRELLLERIEEAVELSDKAEG
jgi:hypothetical protein